MFPVLLSLFLHIHPSAAASPMETPTDSVRVYFIYGSRPARSYEMTERKWFGGIHGGHVALEIAPDRILSFRSTEYPCHLFPHKRFSSTWEVKTIHGMWETFPPHNYREEDLKRAVFTIPVTATQKKIIDSLAERYLKRSPYDYATLGMRCASASYDILAKAGLFKPYGSATWWKIIMPRDLRTALFRKTREAGEKGWKVALYEGSKRRIWEED
jgi:hypothetical protein